MGRSARLLNPIDPTLYSGSARHEDQRLRELIIPDPSGIDIVECGDVVLIGFPSDEGVRRNDGRIGASKAPDCIRRQLSALAMPEAIAHQESRAANIRDVGNVQCTRDVEEDQKRLGHVVRGVLSAGAFPIVMGGGHETAFGHYLGYAQARRRVRILNIDAHFDVRPLRNGLGHSGSPFRQIIEDRGGYNVTGGYLCIGIQHQSNAPDAFRFMRSHHLDWVPLDAFSQPGSDQRIEDYLSLAQREEAGLMLTVDLDGIRQADSPGVSSPSPVGLSAAQAVFLVRRIGSFGVTSMDVVECNPEYDRDQQTARLAAILIWNMIGELWATAAGGANSDPGE